MACTGPFYLGSIEYSFNPLADLASYTEGHLYATARPPSVDGFRLRPIPDALSRWIGRDLNFYGWGHAMSDRRGRTVGSRERASLLRRARSEARLLSEDGKEVSGSGANDLPVQELVVPHDLQRPQNGVSPADARLRQQGEPYGIASVQVGGRRRGSPS